MLELENAHTLLDSTSIRSASIGQEVCVTGLVVRSEAALDRRGNTYLMLGLRSIDGVVVPARWWSFQQPEEDRPKIGQVYLCRATIESYLGERQLNIHEMTLAHDIPFEIFAKATRRTLEELQSSLEALIDGLRPELTALVTALISGDIYRQYCDWPAAQQKHGAVKHGLLAHSIRVAVIAQALIDTYGVDGLPCDRDLVVAASLLHDIGKIHTLPAIAGSQLPERARYLDHITLGVLMVRTVAQRTSPRLSAENLESLLHAILAHHGQLIWGSPVEPQTVEAWLVHLADYAESRLWGWSNEEASNAPKTA